MSERDGKVLYTIAPEDGGWRLTVDRPESECTPFTGVYQFVGPIDMTLRHVASSAGAFDSKHPSSDRMLGGYFLHDKREWKPNVILQVDGREEVERLKELVAEQKENIRLKDEMISHLRHVEKENIRKIGNLRAHRDLIEKGSVYFCDFCHEEFRTRDECAEHGKVCEKSPYLDTINRLTRENEIITSYSRGKIERLNGEISDLKGINARLEDENAHLKDRDTDEDLLDARAKIEQLKEDIAIIHGNNDSLVRLSDRLNDENERLKVDNAKLQSSLSDCQVENCRLLSDNTQVRNINLLYEGAHSRNVLTNTILKGELSTVRKNLEILRAHIIASTVSDQEVLNATANTPS